MPQDPEATSAPVEDPQADTPDEEAGDTEQDTQEAQQPVDYEKRYNDQQAYLKRLERENNLLRRQPAPADDEPGEEPAEPPEQASEGVDYEALEALDRDSLELIEHRVGEGGLEAYTRALELMNRAVTHADWSTALETYHQMRLKGSAPAPEQAKKKAAPTPPAGRVDANRPDAGPDLTELDRQAEAAKGKGDLRGYVSALLGGAKQG